MLDSRNIALVGIGYDSRSLALSGFYEVVAITAIITKGRRIAARMPQRFIMPSPKFRII